jgi:uncharacterized protein YecT (DUF1311 family)
MTQSAMNQAAADASYRADARLQTLIDTVKEYYSAPKIAQFDKVQKAWGTYRKAHARIATAEYKGGSIVPLIYNSALESATIARIVELETELKLLSSTQIKFTDLPNHMQNSLIENDDAPEPRLPDEDS